MPEVVAQSNLGTCPFTSGGGFSTYYPTPLYQLENVKNYLALVVNDAALRPAPGYNGAGRGYPDVAMQGYYYVVFSGTQLYLASGTSASCPAMAGIISTLNAARMRIGKGAVGFVHPALYKHASKFTNDVVGGNNKCTLNGQICCTQGFYATPGWDPASGLGSINYGKMEAVFLTLGKEANGLTPPSTPTSANPSVSPTARPSSTPTLLPSLKPSATPSVVPSVSPTAAPTMIPSCVPTSSPSARPSDIFIIVKASTVPSNKPSFISMPTRRPVYRRTRRPSRRPRPSISLSKFPTSFPTSIPTALPSSMPSSLPPSEQPTTTAQSLIDVDYSMKWLPTSLLTNASSDPPSSGLHGNGQIDLTPTNFPTIKTSGSIRAIQVDIT